MAQAWDIPASKVSQRTSNPIRKIVDQMPRPQNHPKSFIPLSIGDPTVAGNLLTPPCAVEGIKTAVESFKSNGYPHSCGYPHVRAAIAEASSLPNHKLTGEDVIVTSGCSHALEMAIGVLLNEGETLLIPEPAFSLYQTLCDSKGIKTKSYKLLPDRQWEADVDHMKSLLDPTCRAILVNNPSNPCGSVYTEQHLKDILTVAENAKVPIIADEIYANMSFGKPFIAMASLTDTVPILSCGGLAKQYIVPGWRLGWLVVYDKQERFTAVRNGLVALSTIILGPCSIIQDAVPTILKDTTAEWKADLNKTLGDNAMHFADEMAKIPGLKPVRPEGAMYVMVGVDMGKFPDFPTDVEFSAGLLTEQNVMVLPGTTFKAPGFFRVVFTLPMEQLVGACGRIQEFCAAHYKA